MAASYHPCGDSQSAHGSEETTESLEMFHDWSEQPYDVTLVVRDGEQFKAHGNVLRQASPFFEKILDGDWKENREGIIRLEVLTDEIMEDILRFIYTGSVDVGSVERAVDLIAAADYLFLSNLKDIPGQLLEQNLSTSNSILIYHIAERYRCEKLLANTRKFIHLNFASVTKAEDFLYLSGHEVEQWISSEDINISAEDDVFRIILRWINYDKEERKMKFQDLFRHVRLGFVSLNCLLNEVSTNEFVKKDEVCLSSILEWMSGSPGCCDLFSRSPRKALQKEALVVLGKNRTVWFYVPAEDKWYQLPDMYMPFVDNPFIECNPRRLLSFRNNLLVIGFGADWFEGCPCYDPFLNEWTTFYLCLAQPLLETGIEGDIEAVMVVGDEIYVIVEDLVNLDNPRTLFKYTLDSDPAWKIVPFFDWGLKDGVCVVPADKYLYAIGGTKMVFDDDYDEGQEISIREAARFDIIENKWETIASIQRARSSAFGVAVGQNIFIAGGFCLNEDETQVMYWSRTCEMYKVSTNEWQFIANLTIPRAEASMVCVDGALYVLGGLGKSQSGAIIERYDQEKDEWKKLTAAPAQLGYQPSIISASSLRIFLNGELHSVLPNMELLILSEVEAMLSDDDSWSLDSSSSTSWISS